MTYGFKYKNSRGNFEEIGEGEGSGEAAVLEAFDDLRTRKGGTLPAGEYLYGPVAADPSEWAPLTFDNLGNVTFSHPS